MLSITKTATRPTHELWQVAEIGDVKQLEKLLALGADVNARNEAGMTALMVAAYLGRLEMVRALSERGADLNATDNQGCTAEMLADDLGHEEIVRVLVARGIKKNGKPNVTESQSLRSPSLPADEPKSSLPADEPKSSLPTDEPKSSLPADEPKSLLLTDEPKSSLPADEPKSSLLADEPKSSLPVDEPKSLLPTGEPKSSLLANEPKSSLLADEPKSSLPVDEPKVDDVIVEDVTPTVREPKVRTLHEPPDIWNLVPETRVEFHPGSAFFGKITSLKHLALSVLVLMVVAGAVFGFLKLRGLSENNDLNSTRASAGVQAAPPTSTVSSQPVAASDNTQTPSTTDDKSNSFSPQVNESKPPMNESKPPTESSNPEATKGPDIPSEKVDSTTTVALSEGTAGVAPPPVLPRRLVSKHRRSNPSSSTPIGQAVARTQDEDRNRTADAKSNNEKIASPTVVPKEQIKTPSQQPAAPANASTTPKAKVIQWP